MTRIRDVVVIGAGAMGSAAAAALAEAGRDVMVLEKHDLKHDLGGSHGGTRLFRLAHDDETYLLRAQRSRLLWEELEALSGVRLLEVTGGLDHGVDAAAVDEFGALFSRHGIEHEVLDPDEAAERWPGMRFETRVLVQPTAGRLRADRALEVFQHLAIARGAEVHTRLPVEAIRIRSHDDVVELDTPEGAILARQVVVTAGPWAPPLLDGVVALPRITTTQEQPRFFAPLDLAAAWPSFVHWRRGSTPLETAESYGLFEEGSGVKVGLHATGPVVDPDDRDFRIESRADQELMRYVGSWFPGLDATRSTPISCVYDNTDRDTFVIDRVGPVTVATGFCGQGFKFVPLVAAFVTDLVTGRDAVPADFSLAAHDMPATT